MSGVYLVVASFLAAVVVTLGPVLSVLPLAVLRLVVGFLLVTFGLQWLCKAILRASGYKAQRDEEVAFQRALAMASTQARHCQVNEARHR